ncbi:MAG: type II toxin-antitoxin system RelE/ParE family toxin [Acidobacteria bacterium]|nr:type II toxin-antitoxin system RelE/ParE family toxin [Acidobacteriota bacterium]
MRVGSIEQHPKMYRIVYRRMRRAPVDIFSSQIFYEIDKDEIVIYAVYHSARDPKSWKRRAKA